MVNLKNYIPTSRERLEELELEHDKVCRYILAEVEYGRKYELLLKLKTIELEIYNLKIYYTYYEN